MGYNKYLIDDGFYSHLVVDATFETIFEIPSLKNENKVIIPSNLLPFDKRNTALD